MVSGHAALICLAGVLIADSDGPSWRRQARGFFAVGFADFDKTEMQLLAILFDRFAKAAP
jgi:hypothetical protein